MILPRLYPILDTASLDARGIDPVTAARAMVDGGARALQWRSKAPLTRQALDQAGRIAEMCRAGGVLFLVNDRADLAMLLDAGLHLGQDDLPPSHARQLLGAKAVIGYSTHNADQLVAAEVMGKSLDYVALGPIFQTSSKEKPDPVVGLDVLGQLRSMTSRPLVAIGGITRDNAIDVLRAGADSVAVISGLLPEPCTPDGIRERVAQWVHVVNQ